VKRPGGTEHYHLMMGRAAAFVLGGGLIAGCSDTAPASTGVDDTTTDAATAAIPTMDAETRADDAPNVPMSWPTSPPAKVCGNAMILDGPATAPQGAVVVPAGDNQAAFNQAAGTTYWLAPGTHTLGTGAYAQIAPKDGDHFVGAPGAILDGQNKNLYAFTQHATKVVIEHLTIKSFGTGKSNNNEGVVNHDAAHDWTIRYNTVIDNDGAGVFLGTNDVLEANCLKDNGQYGFSAYEANGVSNLTVKGNEIVHNNTDDWETTNPGCGCTGGAKFWNTIGATVTGNWIHDNLSTGLWADTNNARFTIEGNYFENNQSEALFYEISYNARIRYNTFVNNTWTKGSAFEKRNDSFPVSAIYLSEAGGDARVDATYSTLEISFNWLKDNWGGVTLWENADRFCSSPANTSGTYCTLVPGTSLAKCGQGSIESKPYLDDCRWKTQNVSIHDNLFEFDKTTVGCTKFCGRQAILSNFGTFPAWSPYKGDVISQAITLHQNDHFANNTYAGSWRFLVLDTSHDVDWTAWQGAPYQQDQGSKVR
jgi:hypothetical protein